MWLTDALHRAAQQAPNRTGSVFGERQRSWGVILDRVSRMAGALRARDLAVDARVAVLAHNSDNYLELLYAVAWAGGVSVPLNTRWAIAENIVALEDCGADFLFVDEHFLHQVPDILAQLGRPICVVFMGKGKDPEHYLNYEGLIETSYPVEDARRGDETLCGIFYTGGTTGKPKGVMLSHANLTYSSLNWIASWGLSEATVCLHVAGLFHLAGTAPAFAVALACGTNIFLPKFEPEPVFQAIAEHRVNCCLLVPTMISMMMDHPAFSTYDLSSLRYPMYGAAPMPAPVLRRAMELLPDWKFCQGYGMTETAGLVAILPAKFHTFDGPFASKLAAAGRSTYGNVMRIIDPASGAELPRGSSGEITIRGGNVMMAYWNQPEATAAALRDGWLHTGDAGWMDDEGLIHIVDRIKDMIISGGENIYSAEVERAIYQHPGVAECAVIGIPDGQWGETVHAAVVPKENHTLTSDDIILHTKALIAGYKCPRSVEIRSEPLPLSATAKIDKNALRQPFWAGHRKKVA